MDSIFKNKAKEEEVSIIDLKILVVLITRQLRQNFSRLVNGIELVEL
jgi:hypothetical protein